MLQFRLEFQITQQVGALKHKLSTIIVSVTLPTPIHIGFLLQITISWQVVDKYLRVLIRKLAPTPARL
jgi:hypothetical protein